MARSQAHGGAQASLQRVQRGADRLSAAALHRLLALACGNASRDLRTGSGLRLFANRLLHDAEQQLQQQHLSGSCR